MFNPSDFPSLRSSVGVKMSKPLTISVDRTLLDVKKISDRTLMQAASEQAKLAQCERDEKLRVIIASEKTRYDSYIEQYRTKSATHVPISQLPPVSYYQHKGVNAMDRRGDNGMIKWVDYHSDSLQSCSHCYPVPTYRNKTLEKCEVCRLIRNSPDEFQASMNEVATAFMAHHIELYPIHPFRESHDLHSIVNYDSDDDELFTRKARVPTITEQIPALIFYNVSMPKEEATIRFLAMLYYVNSSEGRRRVRTFPHFDNVYTKPVLCV
jgi:hypothetical protein